MDKMHTKSYPKTQQLYIRTLFIRIIRKGLKILHVLIIIA